MTANSWQGFAGSSIGKAHIDSHLPNQDAYFLQQQLDYTVAVVSDGAGSAGLSEQGAAYFSQAVGELLLKLAQDFGESLIDKSNTQTMLRLGLNTVRQQLSQQITDNAVSLRDYHATVTGVLVFTERERALLVQIGDSPLLTSRFVHQGQGAHAQSTTSQPVVPTVDYFTDVTLRGDDNKNEYVNETHFITQDNWQDFLRIEWLDLSQVDCVALMSDGCADLLLQGAVTPPQVYRPFFGNLLFNLCAAQDTAQGNQLIEQTLANPATYRLTGDDKSLIVLLKNPSQYRGIEPVVEDTASAEPTPSAVRDSVWHTNDDAVATTAMAKPGAAHQTALNQHGKLTDDPLGQANHLDQPRHIGQPNHHAAPLPPSQSLSDSGKQRRNVSLAAGLVVLAGAGALAWLNQDKILAVAKPTLLTPIKTAQSLPNVVLSEPTQAFAPQDQLVLTNVGHRFFIQTLVAHPAAVTDKTNLPNGHGIMPLANSIPTVVPTGTLPAKLLTPTGEQPLPLAYQSHCQALDAKAVADYQQLGFALPPVIQGDQASQNNQSTQNSQASQNKQTEQPPVTQTPSQPRWQYQYCRITLQVTTTALNEPSSAVPMAQVDSKQLQTGRIILPQGVAALLGLPVTSSPTLASEPSAASQTGAAIKVTTPGATPRVYYLSNDFLPDHAVLPKRAAQASSTASPNT